MLFVLLKLPCSYLFIKNAHQYSLFGFHENLSVSRVADPVLLRITGSALSSKKGETILLENKSDFGSNQGK